MNNQSAIRNLQSANLPIRLLLLLFTILGTIYAVVVPPFEASDELWHYPMVETIARNWELPVQDATEAGPWRQEASQPPLYYVLAAAATFWIDTSDMETVRHLNPQADIGVVTPDGNVNMVVHHPARESFPWRGTVMAVRLIRFLSVLMGVASVYLTYLIVLEVVPGARWLALGAAAIHAFTPMFVFISASVNNDNLVVVLSGLALLMLLRLARQTEWTTREAAGRYLALGVVLGLAVLTKTSSLALTVITALVVTVRAVRRRSWSEFILGGLLTLLPLLAISGWWFIRNLRLYGDLTGFNAFLDVLGTRDVPADVAQLWRERHSFLAGYWGNFGGLNVPLPTWTYTALNAILITAAIGLLLLLLRLCHLSFVHLSFILSLLWALGVFLPWLLWWARLTWSSQGRLVFPALPVWSMLLALGLAAWFPRRWARWAVAVLAAFLLALTAAAPFAWIAPAYALPEPLDDDQVAAIPHRLDVDLGGVMRLLGFDLRTATVEPGGQVEVVLYWEALRPTEHEYTVFVHLLGEGERVLAQRDALPGLGLLSTTWLEPGARWADHVVLQVPQTAYAPDAAQLAVGMARVDGAERLPAIDAAGAPLGDHVRFGRVDLRARPGDVPNPIDVNFGHRMALVGYDLDRRVVQPGDTLTLTLYWQARRAMETNYTISTQLVDELQRKAAQKDSWPQDGAAPTAAWAPGETIVETRELAIYDDTPAGPYRIRVAVYELDGETIVHLPVISAAGAQLSDHVELTSVMVTP